jgi:D-alanyl-D-alanine carboxypeptidase
MLKTPSEDDEQSGQPIDDTEPPRPAKRRQARLPGQVAHIYADDEHPEIPKIRRASLYSQDAEAVMPRRTRRPRKTESPPSSQKRTTSSRTTTGNNQAKRTRPATSATAPGSKRTATGDTASGSKRAISTNTSSESERSTTRSAKRVSKHPGHSTVESSTQSAADTPVRKQQAAQRRPGRITIEHRRRHAVYEPPSQDDHEPERPPGSPLQWTKRRRGIAGARSRGRPARLASLPDLFVKARSNFERARKNRTLMLVSTIAIALLVLLPIVVHALQSKPQQIQVTGGFSSTSNNTTPTSSKNPHAITITPSDTDHPAPPVYATSAYLLDARTGATLYASNAFAHLPMLSTTKLMTALLAVEKGNLNQNVTITNAMQQDINALAPDSSLMGLKQGETYTLRDLLYGAMLVSGNDAATVIADDIGGNQQNFVAMMNQRAHELGLNDTHYMNPHGLEEDGHYSCAHDLAILGRIDLTTPTLRQIMATNEYQIPQTPQHAAHDMFNGDQFQWWYPGTDGGKPGYDGVKDFIQVVSVTRNGRQLIGVTMNTINWWTDMRDLMNWGFDNFTWISPYDVDLQHPIPFDNEWNYFTNDKKENTIPVPNHGRYYIFTGYSIAEPVVTYFDKNGGLQKFGYPRSMPQTTTTTLTQRFDHGGIQCLVKTNTCHAIT